MTIDDHGPERAADGETPAPRGDENVGSPGVQLLEPPRGPGPRAARGAQRRLRRRQRLQQGMGVFLAATALVGLLIAAGALVGPHLRSGTPSPDATTGPVAPMAEQDTLLLVRHPRGSGPARGVTLLATSAEADDAVVLFIPVGTLVDIPGFGLDRLGLAYQYGGTALVEASVENLLGIDIDHAAGVSDSALAGLLERTGGLELEVQERLVARDDDGSAEVRFEAGTQVLDGERLVEYWTFRQDGESELDTFPRQQLVWTELLAASDQASVAELVGDGAPQLDTSADAEFLQETVTRLAAAEGDDRLQYLLLPVSPFGAEGAGGTYRPATGGVRQLAEGPLAGSVPAGGGPEAVRVQVLNGVGTPGIGQEVDRRLEGAGMRIVLTDNARSFDFDETLILLYREDDRSLEAARRVQEQLGVGTIQISRQPQSVVDLTIVVGADFQAGEPGRDTETGGEDATEEPST